MHKDAFDLVEALKKERREVKELTKSNKLGRVDFLNKKDQIQEAMDQGYPAKKIWECLSSNGEIKIGYNMFLIYFRENMGDKVKKSTAKKKGGIQRISISETQKTESIKSANKNEDTIDKPTGFVYDGIPLKTEDIV